MKPNPISISVQRLLQKLQQQNELHRQQNPIPQANDPKAPQKEKQSN